MQPELFKEFEAQQKKNAKKKSPGSILPRNYVLLSVSYEQVIFITIGIIMLMVLVFSLGVERGRSLAVSPAKKQTDTAAKKADNLKTEPAKAEEKTIPEAAEAAQAEGDKAPEEKKEVKTSSENIFTVQLIAYRSKKSAQKELSTLTKKGYKPFIVTGGGYYQVCVGEYKNQESAQKVIRELKKGYPDGFIRKR